MEATIAMLAVIIVGAICMSLLKKTNPPTFQDIALSLRGY